MRQREIVQLVAPRAKTVTSWGRDEMSDVYPHGEAGYSEQRENTWSVVVTRRDPLKGLETRSCCVGLNPSYRPWQYYGASLRQKHPRLASEKKSQARTFLSSVW